MRVKFQSKGGFNNVLRYFNKKTTDQSTLIRNIADFGTDRLRDGTPEDTGETAAGWEHVTTKLGPNTAEVAWINTAHPESKVNVAKLIELGHGTKNGGYVPPRPYIKQAMTPVWKRLDKGIEELMK